MKKLCKTLTVAVLTAALVLPMAATPDADAAAKPKLSVKGSVSIFTGREKTVTIQNVKKASVKSLQIKVSNKNSTRLVKKILTKKKVGFVLKAVGPHASAVKVKLILKKPVAGKSAYTFLFDTITGAEEAPDANLVDGVKQKDYHATVFLAGETPALWENWVELSVGNLPGIDRRNVSIRWLENGEKGDGISPDSMKYRPDTSAVKDTKAGYDEGTISCEVTNCVSGKKSTDTQIYRVVSRPFIEKSTKLLKDHADKYPHDKAELALSGKELSKNYVGSFRNVLRSYGFLLGMTNDTILHLGTFYVDASEDPQKDVSRVMADEVAAYETECKKNAANLGIPESDVSLFCTMMNDYIQNGIEVEKSHDFVPLKTADNTDGTGNLYLIYHQNGGYIARAVLRIIYGRQYQEAYTRGLSAGLSETIRVDSDGSGEPSFTIQTWCLGWDNEEIPLWGYIFSNSPGTMILTTGGATIFSDKPVDLIDQNGVEHQAILPGSGDNPIFPDDA